MSVFRVLNEGEILVEYLFILYNLLLPIKVWYVEYQANMGPF